MFFSFNIFFSRLFAANLWLSVNYAGYAGWFGILFSLALIVATRIIVGQMEIHGFAGGFGAGCGASFVAHRSSS